MKLDDTLTDIIRQDLESGITPLLLGNPGIGKSAVSKNIGYAMNTKVFVLLCNQLAAKEDLTGVRLVPTADGKSYEQVFYPHQTVREAIVYAEAHPNEFPVLSLDEINRAGSGGSSDVTSAILTFITERKIGSFELPENLRLIATGNDRGNVTILDDASISRFSIYRVEADAENFLAIHAHEINSYVKKVLEKHPESIYGKGESLSVVVDGTDADTTISINDAFDTGEEMRQLATPRTIKYVSDWLNMATPEQLQRYLQTPTIIDGNPDNKSDLLTDVLEAKTGRTQFTANLIAVITEDLSSNQGSNSSAPQVTIPRPSCYAALKTAGSIDELENMIAPLSQSERSASLLTAISEHEDNARLIELLSKSMPQMEGEHVRTLVAMLNAQQYDRYNLTALLDSGSPLAMSLSATLSSFVS